MSQVLFMIDDRIKSDGTHIFVPMIRIKSPVGDIDFVCSKGLKDEKAAKFGLEYAYNVLTGPNRSNEKRYPDGISEEELEND